MLNKTGDRTPPCRVPKLANRSQPLVGRSSPHYQDMWRKYCCLTSFSDGPMRERCLTSALKKQARKCLIDMTDKEIVQIIQTGTGLQLFWLLWSPYVIGQTIIFLPCDFYLLFSSLWPPYIIGQAIIFLHCGFYLLSSPFFFPRLISAVGDWMSTIPYFHTWCGLSANVECMSEMCCTRLAENTGRKNDAKIAIWAPSHNFVGLYLRN